MIMVILAVATTSCYDCHNHRDYTMAMTMVVALLVTAAVVVVTM